MKRPLVGSVGRISMMLVAAASVHCTSDVDDDSVATIRSALTATAADPVPCAALSDAVVANTSNVMIGAGALVDSYQSSLGAYGGTNVGSAAIVQAATTITNNGGVVHGTQKQHAPAGFAVIPVPSGAKNLPLGASTPGSLNIGTASQSITLAPGNYVATNISVSAPGAINVSPAGQVRIWVTGNLSLGGNLNLKGIPRNLAFLVTNSQFVTVNPGALYGIIYAPASGVVVNSQVFGTVIGSSVTLNIGRGGAFRPELRLHVGEDAAARSVIHRRLRSQRRAVRPPRPDRPVVHRRHQRHVTGRGHRRDRHRSRPWWRASRSRRSSGACPATSSSGKRGPARPVT